MPPAHWVHDLSPFVVQFTENFGIRYYGLGYMLGFLGAAWLFYRYWRAGRSRLPSEKISDLMVALVIGVLVGGRLGYFLLYKPDLIFSAPLEILKVWDGGMASHGGFAGVALALAWYARSQKIPFLHLGDLVVSAAPLGLMLVRIANFINGELWGKVSYVSWAVIFPRSAESAATPLTEIAPRHPSQLYEAALEGAVLLALMQWRFWRSDIVRDQPGRLSGEFFVGYALARMICEHFREPDATLILGLSRGSFYSIFIIASGLFLILRKPARKVEIRR